MPEEHENQKRIDGFTFKTPPPRGNGRATNHHLLREVLRANPGEWAVLPNSASVPAWMTKTPFEATRRGVSAAGGPKRFDLYVRFNASQS